MSSSKASREPVDRKPNLVINLWPWRTQTIAEIAVGFRDHSGPHVSRIAYWHLDVTRADVEGRPTDDVLRVFINGLVRHLDGAHDPADYQVTRTPDTTAEGPGAPLGATGGTVTQDSLPGI